MDNETMQKDSSGQWSIQTLGWLMVASWFCASLLSQTMYIVDYGVPYGPEVLLERLGNWYWIIAIVELAIWALVGILVYARVKKVKSLSSSEYIVPAR